MDIPLRRALLAVALVAVLVPAAGAGDGQEEDPPWWETTGLDGDGDGLDDDLEAQIQAAGSEEVPVLVDYARAPTPGQVEALEDRGATVDHVVDAVPVVAARAPADRVRDLSEAPGVVLVEKDRTVEPLLDESRPLVNGGIVDAGMGYDGDGVTVAVFDTGVDADHPDLQSRVIKQYDATRDDSLAGSLVGDTSDPVEPGDTDGHGTHVAGTVAGPGTESGGQYVGLAPGADLVSIKVFDEEGRARSSYLLRGIDWVLDHKRMYRIRIMQMSIGGEPTDGTDAVSRAIGNAYGDGLLSVVAAGNTGPDNETVTFPGVAPEALTVGAVDGDKKVAEFSARGPTVAGVKKPEMVAPGVDITSTMPPEVNGGSNYGELSGTSMAAPHVAGVAAAAWEANESMSPALAKLAVVGASSPVGPTPHEWHPAYGWGFLDAESAVTAARNPAVLTQEPFRETAMNLDFNQQSSILDRFRFRAQRQAQDLIPSTSVAAVAGLAALAALARSPRRP